MQESKFTLYYITSHDFFTVQSAFPTKDFVTVLWASQKLSALSRSLHEICTHSSIHPFILQQLSIINYCCPFFHLSSTSFTSLLDFLLELTPKSDLKVSHFLLGGLIWSQQQLPVCTAMVTGAISHGHWTPELGLSVCAWLTTFNPELFAFKQMLDPFLLLKLICPLFPSFRSGFLCHPTGQWINSINYSELMGRSYLSNQYNIQPIFWGSTMCQAL